MRSGNSFTCFILAKLTVVTWPRMRKDGLLVFGRNRHPAAKSAACGRRNGIGHRPRRSYCTFKR